MNTLRLAGTIIYFTMLLGLCLYGLHRYWMIYLYYRHRRRTTRPAGRLEKLPSITVQLPLYNERYVAERLIDAVAASDYPRDRLEIQVLDDSTDGTREIVAAKVATLRRAGHRISHLHRTDRVGYKAGALAAGLRTARGEFIAIFDADFVPQPGLLRRLIHEFADPGVGLVQARWGHLNADASVLTRVQAILLDAHFMIEHTARSRSGRWFNFNGTAGIWRRRCIEQAGGWQHDTLAEDMDLSYRAQLHGWRFVYRPDVVVPAELPVEINAFKSQQHRWAKGAIQTCKKLLPRIWQTRLPPKIKLEAMVHLTSNFAYVMLLMLCLTFRAALWSMDPAFWGGTITTKLLLLDLPLFMAASVSVVAFYVCAQRELHRRWWQRLVYVPSLMAVGIGLSVNNARAVLEAVFNHQSEFVRTPKYGDRPLASLPRAGVYGVLRGWVPWFELAMGAYFIVIAADLAAAGNYAVLPFVAVMIAGFLYVGGLSLASRRWPGGARSTQGALAAVEA